MLIRKTDEVLQNVVDMEGVKGVKIQVLISQEEGAPNFVMRRFEIEPGGHTPYHQHDWEHEVYVLSGEGALVGEGGELPLAPDTSAYVAPDDMHNFKNTGDGPFVFLCIIPKEGK
ncbi:MAG: cupin domain-containing protein [bacterium]|nr:cupin domain-containing protein [bacterium]